MNAEAWRSVLAARGDPGPIPGQCKEDCFLNKVCGYCLREHSSNTYETADIILVKETSFENVFVDLHIYQVPEAPWHWMF